MTVEEAGEYVGIGETEQERLVDADLQDLLDDMTKDHLEDMAAYLLDMAAYVSDLTRDDDPHHNPQHVEARTKLGRLMIWQGWSPVAYYRGA